MDNAGPMVDFEAEDVNVAFVKCVILVFFLLLIVFCRCNFMLFIACCTARSLSLAFRLCFLSRGLLGFGTGMSSACIQLL